MKKLLVFLAISALFLAAVPVAAQNGAVVTRGRACALVPTVNPCCGDLISFCWEYQTVFNASGSHTVTTGTGRGSTGNKYTAREVSNWINVGPQVGTPDDYDTYVFTMKVDSDNSDCGYTMKVLAHVTKNAAGEIVVEFVIESIKCDTESIIIE